MEDTKYTLARGLALSLAVEDADSLLSLADGNCALLYLYLLRTGGVLSPKDAARDLKRTDREISETAERLRALGLLSPSAGGPAKPPAAAKLPPADELPEYSAQDISLCSKQDNEFRAVVTETQRLLCRMLSGADLNKLFGIYDYLGLPGEVILMLINRCVSEYNEKYGSGRLPTMRTIEKEAYAWANREIISLDSAEEYVRALDERKSASGLVKQVLGIHGRDLSLTERRYVDGWLDMGFGAPALEIAYDRTVTQTGKLQWKYMNSIICSWHEKGLHTPEEIKSGDALRSAARKKPDSGPVSEADELERMMKMISKNKR